MQTLFASDTCFNFSVLHLKEEFNISSGMTESPVYFFFSLSPNSHPFCMNLLISFICLNVKEGILLLP